MLSSDRIATRYGEAQLAEQLSISTTAAYTIETFFPGQMIRVVSSIDAFIELVPDYIFGGKFGDDEFEAARLMFASDEEDAELSNRNWDISAAPDETVVTLNMTSPIAGARDLEFLFDDQDTILQIPLNGTLNGGVKPLPVAAQAMILRIRYLQSDATKDLQYTIEESGDGTTGVQYWDDGAGAWTTVLADAWTNVAGSATDTTESFTWTTDARRTYKLLLRPATDYAGESCNIDEVACYPVMATTDGIFCAQDVEYFFTAKERCKVACDLSAGLGTLHIARMVG